MKLESYQWMKNIKTPFQPGKCLHHFGPTQNVKSKPLQIFCFENIVLTNKSCNTTKKFKYHCKNCLKLIFDILGNFSFSHFVF